MQEILLKTKDNINIAINHYKNGFNDVVILAPGWFMTKDSKPFKQMSKFFSKYFDVISMDFRGHGKSSGFYTFTTKEVDDISTVIEHAHSQYKHIYLIGFSLGGALSLIAGAKYDYIDKIIAVSAPTSFNKIENQVWKKEAWLPTLQKYEFKRWISIRPSIIIRPKINPIDIVNQIQAPTLFIAGEKDPTVGCWHCESLYDSAVCKKNYVLFENGLHAEDLFIQNKRKFCKLCLKWLFAE